MWFLFLSAIFAMEKQKISMDIAYYENGKKILESQWIAEDGKSINLQGTEPLNQFRIKASIVDGDEVHIDFSKIDKNQRIVTEASIITFDSIQASIDTESANAAPYSVVIKPSILK